MRIGIITAWLERGAGYVSRQYYNTLSEDHDVFIYARGGEDYPVNDDNWNLPCVTWGKRINSQIPTFIDKDDFFKWLNINHIDIVFFNEQWWWKPIQWCKEIELIIGSYVDYYTSETIPLFYAYDFLICNTKRHFDLFKDHDQAFYVPWGTDISLFKPRPNRIKEDDLVFFHSAGMNPIRKGTDHVIRAFEQMEGESKLIIHSQVNLILHLPQLKSSIEKLTKIGKIEIITRTVPAPGLYHLGDVYVYPARLDGIGLTIPEALASGLPVIASNEPPMNEFVFPDAGQLVDIKNKYYRKDNYYWPMCEVDIYDLKRKMEYYEENIEKINLFKENSRKQACLNLDWTKNSSILKDSILNIKNINSKKTSFAMLQINMYEKERKTSLLNWLYTKSPKFFDVLRYIKRRFLWK